MRVSLTVVRCKWLGKLALVQIFALFFVTNIFSQACECTNCPQFMPDGFTGNFYINIQNACNNTLGQNGQGVCGVRLHFNHEYLGDLRITLTSPAGQTVTLVGPIGFFGPTDFTEWDVTFLPCADPVTPDPGFSGTWNNNQAWGLSGNYSGTYHPNIGCLENFNTGPVNGTWTLTVVDGQAIDVGNFLDYEIIFCDPSCIECFSCAANAGQLPQPDVSACQGASSLVMNLPPTYTAPNTPPPAAQYTYAYVIGGAGGVLLEYQSTPNLSGYDPGVYTICGISYLTADANDLPDPDGVLTINTLRNQLNSTTPPFCGKITTNCVGVTINPRPDDEEYFETVCAPECFLFEGNNYCNSGTYNIIATTAQGCTYTKTLNLTVLQPTFGNINEIVCNGNCSVHPLFPDACSTGNYTETITNQAGCDSTLTLHLTVLTVTANISNAPVVPCGGGTVQLQGLGSSAGAGVSYLWTATNGGAFIGPTNQINANITAAGTYQLRVCKIQTGFSCCDSATIDISAQTDPPDPPLQVNGLSQLCQNQTLSYNIAPVSGATSYTWTVPTGVTVNSGGTGLSVNVTWASPDPGQVCVTANNACGPSTPTCIDVGVNAAPVVLAPQGPDTVCVGTTSTFTVPLVSNATSYAWTVSSPATIVSGQGTESVEISWNGGTTANVCVRAANTCGQGPQLCKTVVIRSQPVVPVVNGNNTVCAGSVSNYTLTNLTGATSFEWEVTGGTITGGNNSAQIQVTWGNGPTGTVCANAVNTCGESQPNCINVTITPGPAQPVIAGPASLCAGATATYTLTPVAGAAGYTWTVPAGASIVSGQNTASITVSFPGALTGNICAVANSTCGASPQACIPVTILANPVANAGANRDTCANSIHLQAVASIGNGQWSTINGPGTATFVNPQSASTAVSVSVAGVYQFQWSENNMTCTDQDTVQVTFNTIPVAGIITPLCDGANENYTISFPITGGSGPYTVTGGTVANGVFTSNQIVNATPYTFTVVDNNGCQSAAINGAFNCNCATNAGTMSQTPLEACEGQTVTAVANGDAVLDANDVAVYVLHEGAGTTIVNQIAQNSTGTFGFTAGMIYEKTYYISLVVGNNSGGVPATNDPCRSIAQGQPAIFYQIPTSNAGADQSACGLTLTLAATTGIGPGSWTVTNSPSGGSLNIADQANPATAITATVNGAYTLVWTIDNHGCTASDQVIATFNESPTAGQISSDCDGTNTLYTITFPINNGTGPYQVNGVALTGNTFTSGNIISEQPYSFVIEDANGCLSDTLNGTVKCDCATNAGNMDLTPLSACEGVSVTAQHLAGSETLDADDVSAYVLHEGSGTTLSNPVATNTTGIFSWQTGMTYGQTYYISYVAGNNLGGNPNPADPCFSVSQGQPVVFYSNPTPSAGLAQQTCGNTLNLSATGTGTWSVAATPAGGSLTIADPNDPNSGVSASVSGDYTMTWTVVVNGCTGTDNTVVTFYPLPQLDTLTRTCDGANENFTVTLTIMGGTAPYSVNGSAITGSTFVSTPLTNNASYSFNVEDANGCVMPAVTGAFNCDCATDAGTMQQPEITACESDSITVVANNDATLDNNDITAFILHEGAGPAISNQIARNKTGTFGFNPATMSYNKVYYVSLVAGNPQGSFPNPNDPCFSVAVGQPVKWLKNPTPDAGVNAQICGTTIALQATQGSFSGVWSLTSGTGTAAFINDSNAGTSVTVSQTGKYVFRWTEANQVCTGLDEVEVEFNPLPTIDAIDETCNPTNTQYLVTFNVTGGTGPYTVSGLTGTFSGSAFTSSGITSNQTYNITVTDSKGCTAGPVTGIKNCNCTTDAGSMVTSALLFCAGDSATGVWNNDAVFDGDDIVRFMLHNNAGGVVGSQVLGVSTSPVFAFGPTIQIGVTYYISAICGNNIAGQVDLNDPCLSVAPGTPVRWKALPTADLSGDATICAGSSATLSFAGTGSAPLTVSYSVAGGTPATITINSATIQLPVSPVTTTQYTLLSVTDGTLPTCKTDLNDVVTITVNAPVDAGTALPDRSVCANDPEVVDLAGLLTGAQTGGLWSFASGAPPTGFNAAAGTFNTANLPAATYAFVYKKAGLAPCPDDQTTVQVIIRPQPVADAGADQTLDCIITEAILGGNGSTTGTGVTYAWNNGSDTRTINTGVAGTYTLTVTNSFGCTAVDQAIIIVNNEQPQIDNLAVFGERCAGENNGTILANVSGGSGPYTFNLTGFPPAATGAFGPLTPGVYTLEVEDANGCTDIQENIEVKAAIPLSVNLGPDIDWALGDSTMLAAEISVPITQLDTIIWFPLLDPANAGKPQQQFFPIRTTDISITVVDTSGCRAEDQLIFFVDTRRHIYVPNIFNPSGSENNVVTVYGGRDVESIELFRIYDRWGEEVWHEANFQPNDITKGWTGSFRGKNALPGVYIWTVVALFKDGERELFTGDVTISR